MGYRAKTKIEVGEGASIPAPLVRLADFFFFAVYSTWEPVHKLVLRVRV